VRIPQAPPLPGMLNPRPFGCAGVLNRAHNHVAHACSVQISSNQPHSNHTGPMQGPHFMFKGHASKVQHMLQMSSSNISVWLQEHGIDDAGNHQTNRCKRWATAQVRLSGYDVGVSFSLRWGVSFATLPQLSGALWDAAH